MQTPRRTELAATVAAQSSYAGVIPVVTHVLVYRSQSNEVCVLAEANIPVAQRQTSSLHSMSFTICQS